VVLAQTFVSLPFLVIALEGAARTAGAGYDGVAATLGARPSTVWWTVTLPLIGPGLVSGAVLAFARALGEFGATLTFGPCHPSSQSRARRSGFHNAHHSTTDGRVALQHPLDRDVERRAKLQSDDVVVSHQQPLAPPQPGFGRPQPASASSTTRMVRPATM
jgi:hypothetical protein